jgi:hypothetical protein
MILLEMSFRLSFIGKIKKFCTENDLDIYFESGSYWYIGGHYKNIDKLIEYNNQLEDERKKKSFWFKLWN